MASNAPNNGRYDCKFVETPPDKLVCQICLHVSATPHQVTCCGRVYCKACLDEHKKRSSICPNCREKGQDFPDTRGEQEIKSLKVKCNNCENGCDWAAELWSLDDHLATCGYTLLRCQNECLHNAEVVWILRQDLDHHLKNECPNRQYQCPYCEAIGRHCDITTTHLDTCPMVKVPCPNSDCKALVPRFKLSVHLSTCEYTLLHCPNKCLHNAEVVRILRQDLDHHLKNECHNRQYECPHCKDTGRYCDITTTHFDTCPKMEIPCPNSDCKALVPRCELADHRPKCQYEAVSCKYKGIGCTKEPLRKELQQHEEDDTFHLHFAIETVNKLQEEMKVMADNGIAGRVGPCVFNMTKFNQHKSSKQEWRSSPFYTHPGGYKMCIKAYTNGFGEGAGTHVSVGAYLMKGRNDDNLPWPFTGEVTFTLLNQLADENHHTRTVSFPRNGEVSRRVVDGEMAPTGYGWSKFISHEQLDHNADQNCQYLKDDCLYFRIKVQAAKPTKPWLTSTV